MIYYVDSNWNPLSGNPFREDGEFTKDWSVFIYSEQAEPYTSIDKNGKVYGIRSSFKKDENCEILSDFLEYEESSGRNVIVSCDIRKKYRVMEKVAKWKRQDKRKVRDTDPHYVVHSTTKAAWREIQKSKYLYSANYLKRHGTVTEEIGFRHFLEPSDYSDYIMLDYLDGCGELVVNSRQLGAVNLDPDCSYTPGVRMYLNAYHIIEDGLGVRDGLHVLKVKHRLSLEKYLEMYISEDMAPQKIWTPTTFTDWANQHFIKYMK